MSARDDYPWLANRERAFRAQPSLTPQRFNLEIGPALDEIDRLRKLHDLAHDVAFHLEGLLAEGKEAGCSQCLPDLAAFQELSAAEHARAGSGYKDTPGDAT